MNQSTPHPDERTARDSLLQSVREYWNENVSNWKIATAEPGTETFFRETERYRFAKLEYLGPLIDSLDCKGKQVLDIGCGLGNDLARFIAQGADATGVDIAPRAVELARTNLRQRGMNATIETMDGGALDLASDRFDIVYCHTVVHFAPAPEALIREIYRVLKPGGLAVVMTINRYSWLFTLHKLARQKMDYMDAPVFNVYSYNEFRNRLDVFDDLEIRVERFPVRTEVHTGWKAFIYNRLFVDGYNALPDRIIGKSGYHLIALGRKKAAQQAET